MWVITCVVSSLSAAILSCLYYTAALECSLTHSSYTLFTPSSQIVPEGRGDRDVPLVAVLSVLCTVNSELSELSLQCWLVFIVVFCFALFCHPDSNKSHLGKGKLQWENTSSDRLVGKSMGHFFLIDDLILEGMVRCSWCHPWTAGSRLCKIAGRERESR